MLSSVVTVLALAASITNVAAGPIRHATRGYRQDAEILEDYTGYHVRYLALECHKQHNTEFFDACCHPLLRSQKLSDRPAKCIPSASASSSAALAEPTAAPVDEDPIPDYDDDCSDDEPTTPAAPAPTTSIKSEAYTPPAPSPTSTKAQATTEEKPAPTKDAETTSTKPATKTSEPEPEPTKGSGGGEGDITGGFATFFEQNGVAGACGKVHAETDKVVALDYRRYGPLEKQSGDCGRTVVITNTKNGKSVTAIVADACPSCKNANCLDLSHGAFDEIATREEGMVPISWHFA